jgi:hypothetical protein
MDPNLPAPINAARTGCPLEARLESNAEGFMGLVFLAPQRSYRQ